MSDCPLTPRQFAILALAPFGNKEIGRRLKISERTVKNQFTNIGWRLALHAKHLVLGRTSQLIYALKQGWYTLDEIEYCTVRQEKE